MECIFSRSWVNHGVVPIGSLFSRPNDFVKCELKGRRWGRKVVQRVEVNNSGVKKVFLEVPMD